MLSIEQVNEADVNTAAEAANIDYTIIMKVITFLAGSANPQDVTTKNIAEFVELEEREAIKVHRIAREQLKMNTLPKAGEGKKTFAKGGETKTITKGAEEKSFVEVEVDRFDGGVHNRMENLIVIFRVSHWGSKFYPLNSVKECGGVFKFKRSDDELKGTCGEKTVKRVQQALNILAIDPMVENSYLTAVLGIEDRKAFGNARKILSIGGYDKESEIRGKRKSADWTAPAKGVDIRTAIPQGTRDITKTGDVAVLAEFFSNATHFKDATAVIFTLKYGGSEFYPLAVVQAELRIEKDDPRLGGLWGEKTLKLIHRCMRLLSADPLLTNDLLKEFVGTSNYAVFSAAKKLLGVKRDVKAARDNINYKVPSSELDLLDHSKKYKSIKLKKAGSTLVPEEPKKQDANVLKIVATDGTEITLNALGNLVGRDEDRNFFEFGNGIFLIQNDFAGRDEFQVPDTCKDLHIIEKEWASVAMYALGLEGADVKIYKSLQEEDPLTNGLEDPKFSNDNESRAQQLYAAYNLGGDPATAGLNYQGKPCPEWSELPENIREKWKATANFDDKADVFIGGGSGGAREADAVVERVSDLLANSNADEAPLAAKEVEEDNLDLLCEYMRVTLSFENQDVYKVKKWIQEHFDVIKVPEKTGRVAEYWDNKFLLQRLEAVGVYFMKDLASVGRQQMIEQGFTIVDLMTLEKVMLDNNVVFKPETSEDAAITVEKVLERASWKDLAVALQGKLNRPIASRDCLANAGSMSEELHSITVTGDGIKAEGERVLREPMVLSI